MNQRPNIYPREQTWAGGGWLPRDAAWLASATSNGAQHPRSAPRCELCAAGRGGLTGTSLRYSAGKSSEAKNWCRLISAWREHERAGVAAGWRARGGAGGGGNGMASAGSGGAVSSSNGSPRSDLNARKRSGLPRKKGSNSSTDPGFGLTASAGLGIGGLAGGALASSPGGSVSDSGPMPVD